MASRRWKEIANRARAFSKDWRHVEREDADAKSFWDEFFEVFGIKRRKVATFEKAVKKINDKDGYIDLLWKGTLLIEHKSRGKNLTKAFKQAKDYFPGLKADEEPRYILLCDFWHFELHDLDEDKVHRFTLAELDKNLRLFYFIAGYRKQRIRTEEAINRVAVDALGELHDSLKNDGYSGHRALDAAVDAAYALSGGKRTWKSDSERVAFLFTRYQSLTSLGASYSSRQTPV